MRQSPETRKRRARFVVTFVLCAGALLTLYSFPYARYGVHESWFAGYLSAYAHVVGAFLRIFDPAVRVVGAEIVGRVSLTVAKNCDAMDVNIVLAAAIVAFPARWARRAVGIAAGTGILAVVNVIRIVTLYHVIARWPDKFEVVHAEVWPLAMVVIAFVAFVRWARWVEAVDAPA